MSSQTPTISEFFVLLKEVGTDRDGVIAAICQVTHKSREDAEAIVDRAPSVIMAGASLDEATACKQAIEAAGAKVEIEGA